MHTRTEGVGPYVPVHVTAAVTAAPLGRNLSTTSATTIVAGPSVAVTPASMTNIMPGLRLNVSGGTGTAEDIVVLSVTPTTFSANFVFGHSGAYKIVSFHPQYFGRIVVNKVGSADTAVTFYDGSPLLYAGGTGTGVPFAIISGAGGIQVAGQYFYDSYISRGLFYTISGTTMGDYTITFVDDNQ